MKLKRTAKAFSMIELLAVIVIMGILAATVSFAARGLLKDHVLKSDLERLKTIDAFAREMAKSGMTGDLVFDSLENSVVFEPDLRQSTADGLQLKRQFRSDLLSVQTPGFTRSHKEKIAVLGSGITPTYAVVFAHDQAQVVLMFVGGTGYSTIVEDVNDVPVMH